jgi:hypothetical protein
MRKVIALIALLFVLAGCAGYIDKSQPWRDASGQLHNKYTCWMETSTIYSTIRTGKTSSITVPHIYTYRACEYE